MLVKLLDKNDTAYTIFKGSSGMEHVIEVDLWSTNITHLFVFE